MSDKTRSPSAKRTAASTTAGAKTSRTAAKPPVAPKGAKPRVSGKGSVVTRAKSGVKPALAAKKTASGDKSPKADKPQKARKALVRDSFTMPRDDFDLIDKLKARALDAKRAAKKSELLRAGLHALNILEAAALAAALDSLVPVKTGRPQKKD
jgi:hypothetical protein